MKGWYFALAPWMVAASAMAQSDGLRPAEVVFTHYGKISTPAWQIGQDCFVPAEAVSRWGWKARIGKSEVVLSAENRTAKLPFKSVAGRRLINLGIAAGKFGAGSEWAPGSGTFVVYAVVRSVAVRDGVISVDSTLPIKPVLSFLDGPARLILDFSGAKLDSKAKLELVPESRVGQFEATSFRVVVETTKHPILPASDIRPSRDYEFNYGSAPDREAAPPDDGNGTSQVEPPVQIGEFQSTINDFASQTGIGGSVLQPTVPNLTAPTLKSKSDSKVVLAFNPSNALMSTPQVRRLEANVVELTLPGAVYEGDLEPKLDTELIQATSVVQGPASTIFTFVLIRPLGVQVTTQKGVTYISFLVPKVGDGKLSSRVVVVDAGHGGHDGGARAPNGSAQEKQMTLAISKNLAEALSAEGATVVMTRVDDTFVPLKERPAIATRTNADFFISIHINSNAAGRTSTGGMTFFHQNDAISQLLAECIQSEIGKVSKIKSLGAWSDGRIYDTGFAVLRLATMPAVLIEMGFINNPNDRTRMMTKDFQIEVANAIVRGLKVFLGNEK